MSDPTGMPPRNPHAAALEERIEDIELAVVGLLFMNQEKMPPGTDDALGRVLGRIILQADNPSEFLGRIRSHAKENMDKLQALLRQVESGS